MILEDGFGTFEVNLKESALTTPIAADNFKALNVRGLVERANEILNALKVLASSPSHAWCIAQTTLLNRDLEFDRWEMEAWRLASLELQDFVALQDDKALGEVTNGGFPISKVS